MAYELKHAKCKVIGSECDFEWAGKGEIFKYNNKRIGLSKKEVDGKSRYLIYGRMIGENPPANTTNLGRNVHETWFALSEESMEIIALTWAKMNGLTIIEKH